MTDEPERKLARQQLERQEWGEACTDLDLVFARESGEPLRPHWVLNRFHELSTAAELPRARLDDLRPLAATLVLQAGVPLALVSKS